FSLLLAASMPEALDELGVGDFVYESGDSHALWGSFNMPNFSFKPLPKIFRGFPSLCLMWWISTGSFLLKVVFYEILFQITIAIYGLRSLWNTSPYLLILSSYLRLGDADMSRRMLEKTPVGSELLDMLRERLGFSLLLRSPLLFDVLDSEYCGVSWIFEFLPEHPSKDVSDASLSRFFEVCPFSLPTVFRTMDVGGVRLSSAGPLMEHKSRTPADCTSLGISKARTSLILAWRNSTGLHRQSWVRLGQMFNLTQEEWDDFKQIHKRAASLKSKPLPYSDVCEIVFQSICANDDGQWTNTGFEAFAALAFGPSTSRASATRASAYGASTIRERVGALNMDDDPLVEVVVAIDDDDGDDENSHAHNIHDEVRPKKKAKTSHVTMDDLMVVICNLR
nr:hypothetical protein [Tanacetum cinerariifolium]